MAVRIKQERLQLINTVSHNNRLTIIVKKSNKS